MLRITEFDMRFPFAALFLFSAPHVPDWAAEKGKLRWAMSWILEGNVIEKDYSHNHDNMNGACLLLHLWEKLGLSPEPWDLPYSARWPDSPLLADCNRKYDKESRSIHELEGNSWLGYGARWAPPSQNGAGEEIKGNMGRRSWTD